MLESVTVTVEGFFEEVAQTIEETVQGVHHQVSTDIEQFLQTVVGTQVEFQVHFDSESFFNEAFGDDVDSLFAPKLDPSINVHPACRGCRHYHGRLYGGKLLVCGMHPYGWEDSHCPDWEEK